MYATNAETILSLSCVLLFLDGIHNISVVKPVQLGQGLQSFMERLCPLAPSTILEGTGSNATRIVSWLLLSSVTTNMADFVSKQ